SYRDGRPAPELAGKTIILVDDGLATGATMRAAVKALRQRGAAKIVVAVPVGPPDTCREFEDEADEVICASAPEFFQAVGQYYEPLLELIGDARIVLLGEASHGTHEFYFGRAQITRRLIEEKNFTVLAIEADWPDASRVHRYVRGASADANANEALSGFRRFPTWMWRNTVVVEFVEWMREFNQHLDPKRAPAGFYGMDLYGLHASIDAVLTYLQKVDPDAAARARL